MRHASCRFISSLLGLAAVLTVGLLSPIRALAFGPSGVSDPLPLELPRFERAHLPTEAAFRASPAWRSLAAEAGAEPSRLILDARSGAPGILRLNVPLLPASSPDPAAAARDAALAFVTRHAALLRVDPSTLELDPVRSVTLLLEGRLILVNFALKPHGIAVEGARLSLSIVRGNLVLIESERLIDTSSLDATPRVTADSARAVALARLGLDARDVTFEAADTLRFLPRIENDRLTARVAWKLRFAQARSLAGWEAWVDARDGSLLALFDSSHYDCPPPAPGAESEVRGGILPNHPADAEVVRGMPYSRVTLGGAPLNTNFGGHYTYPGGAGDATFSAIPGFTTCVSCSSPTTGAAPVDSVTGDAHFGVGGADIVGNGVSIKSERTAFYHLCRVHDFSRKWLPAAEVPTGVDLQINYASFFTCNAAWRSGVIYLLPESAGCVNAGEHPGIVQHEWGHGLDALTGPGGDWGEGMADHLAWLTNRQSKVAPGFSKSMPDSLLREMDEDLAATLRVWPAAECGGEVHCLGEVYGQADWHLGRLLRQDPRFGEEAGWHLMEALFFLSATAAGSIAPDTPGSIYEEYAVTLEALFGDGNMASGVPLASMLNAAYSHHGMASASPYPEEAYPCPTPPSAPVPAAQVTERDPATGHPNVLLTWTAAPGVDHDVLRSDDGANHSKLLLATVPAGTASYTDAQVELGATYHYVIAPHLSSGCYPLMDVVTAVLVQSGLSLPQVDIDVSGDGLAAPGETMDLVPHVRNDAGGVLTGAVALLEPGDPRATLVQDTSTVGSVLGGATNVGTAWRMQLANDPALCGQTLAFPVRLTSNEGCWPATFSFLVGGGGSVEPVGDVLRATHSAETATLDWSLTSSASTLFRVYRRVSARQFPATGAMTVTADSVSGRTWTEPDGLASLPLAYYLVKAIDACGNEEP